MKYENLQRIQKKTEKIKKTQIISGKENDHILFDEIWLKPSKYEDLKKIQEKIRKLNKFLGEKTIIYLFDK